MPASSRETRRAGSTKQRRRKDAGVRTVSKADDPAPSNVEDLFGGGYSGDLLKGEFQTERIYAWFQKRHRKGLTFLDEDGTYRRNGHEWKVPYGVRFMLTQRLMPAQVAQKYPFLVTWRSKKTGKRMFKKMMSLPHAIIFVAERAQYADPHACIINRLGMDIPPKMRNKIPAPWKWCPRCMKPRKFRRVYQSTGDPQVFYAQVKTWHTEKVDKKGNEVGYWVYPERKLALMCCQVCGVTNREHKFRRSNQPWNKVKVKKGKTRLKKKQRRK